LVLKEYLRTDTNNQSMRVVVLIDNNPDPQGRYLTEHGISLYFEAEGYKWLFDVGASPNFGINARKMGIDILDVDFLVLSHAHRDHTGGLEYFLRKNTKARVIMAPISSGQLFVSYRKQIHHDITINYEVITAFSNRFIFADTDQKLSPNVTIIRNIPNAHPLPKANSLLFQTDGVVERHDDFRHELALAVRTIEGVVLFSGCSHHGILNILNAISQIFKGENLIATIGGTHLPDSDWYSEFETSEEIANIANTINGQYPRMKLITGHCTGKQAQQQFSSILADRFDLFHSGASYKFE
jgi:7,8-dihydropterin-6-yl-methyl-4-(beta-D-ribofuranosyl)aminobenzene 5'-phosphate synthase